MLRPDQPLSPSYTAPIRQTLVVNTDSEDVPPFGVMVPSGYDEDAGAFNIRQATRNGEMSPVIVNGPTPIPAGAIGQGAFEPWPATARYDRLLSSGAEPTAGDTWGLQSGLWTLGKNLPGFTVLTEGLNYLAVFARKATSSLTVEEVDGSPTVAGVTKIKVSNTTLTDNGDGSVTIITGGGSLSVGAVTLGGAQNNYDWLSYDHLIVTTSSTVTFSGFLATATNGRKLRISNAYASADRVLIMAESGSSSAANRVGAADGAVRYLDPKDSIDLFYDTAAARWLVQDYWVKRIRYLRMLTSYRGG